jgi:Na+/proline symporter
MWPQLAEPAEASFVTLALTLLPNGLIGLTISAILAATMTHTDTALNYLASILVRDVYVRVRTEVYHKTPAERELLRIGRIAAFSLGLLAIVTAIIVQRSKGVFDFALLYYSWFSPSMLMPVMLGFVFRKTPSWAAIVSSTAGLVTVLIVSVFVDVKPYQYEVNIFGGVGVTTIVFFLSALFKEKNPGAIQRREKFFLDLDTPATEEPTAWGVNALTSYRIVGILTAAIGVTVMGLSLVPTSSTVRTLALSLGAGVAILGAVIVLYFRKQSQLQASPATVHEERK